MAEDLALCARRQHTLARLLAVVVLGIVALGAITTAAVPGVEDREVTATGTADPNDVLTTGSIRATVEENVVTLTFPAGGGPVTGELRLVSRNEFTTFDCVTRSTFVHLLTGTFTASTATFSGDAAGTSSTEVVSGCGDAQFARRTSPNTWLASLDVSTGLITGRLEGSAPVDFTAGTDPAAFATPTTSAPDTTTDGRQDTEAKGGGGDSGSGSSSSSGIVIGFVAALAFATSIVGYFVFRRRRRPAAAVGVDPCAELREAARRARKACDDARAEQEAAEAAEQAARRERAALDPGLDPNGEASITDPLTGETITQSDLRLREAALGDLWREYRANPTPEKAREVEDEWRRADTPEFREEIRRRAREAVDRESAARERAETARAAATDACARATEAERRYEECIGAELLPSEPVSAPAPEPLPEAEPLAVPPPQPVPAPEPEPVPVPVGGAGGAGGDDEPCTHGSTKWEIIDGPHPFELWPDGEHPTISVRVVARQAADQDARVLAVPNFATSGMTDGLGVTTHEALAAVTFDQWRGALADVEPAVFDGTMFETGTPPSHEDVRATVTVRVPRATFLARCERLLECHQGVWVDTGQRAFRHPMAGQLEPFVRVVTVHQTIWDSGKSRDRELARAARDRFWADIDRVMAQAVAEAAGRVDQNALFSAAYRRCSAG